MGLGITNNEHDVEVDKMISGRFLGFFTVLLIMTLDASNGKDLLDVVVPYIEAQTTVIVNNA